MTSKNGFGKCSLIDLSKKKKGLFVFPTKKTLMHVEKALFDWPIVF